MQLAITKRSISVHGIIGYIMDPEEKQPIDYGQPVAYDAKGRPLYLRPEGPEPDSHQEPSSTGDEKESVDTPLGEDIEVIKSKHDISIVDYPEVHLDEDEYIMTEIPRSLIGVTVPIVGGLLGATVLIAVTILYPDYRETASIALPPMINVIFPVILLLILDGIFVYVAVWVYYRNRLLVTNKCAVGYVQFSLFDRRIHKASLDRIEDISFHQPGFIASLFNYGRLRMSTIGDESDFRLSFVASPREQSELVNDIVAKHKTHSAYSGRWRTP